MRKFFGIMFFIIVGLLLVGCKAKEVKVTFDSNGGSNVEEMVIKKGSLFELPKEPKLEGHRFLGWQLEGVIFEEGEKVTKNITLVAKWEKLKFTITFDSDGGSDVEKIVKDYGEKLTSLPAPTKANHGFQGWYDGTTKVEAPYTVSKDVTLKAKWEVDTHTITFDSDGGSDVENLVKNYGEKLTSLPAPTKDNHTFDGWYDGDSKVEVPYTVSKDVTLKAKWVLDGRTVSFYVDDELLEDVVVPHGQIVTPPDAPVKDSLRFVGWQLDGQLFDLKSIITKNIRLDALYEDSTIGISVKIKQGSSDADALAEFKKVHETNTKMFLDSGASFKGFKSIEEFETYKQEKLAELELEEFSHIELVVHEIKDSILITVIYSSQETLVYLEPNTAYGKDKLDNIVYGMTSKFKNVESWTLESGEAFDPSEPLTSSVRIKPIVKVTIKFEVEGVTHDTSIILENETLAKAKESVDDPTKDYYIFKGWARKGGFKLLNDTFPFSQHETLIAVFEEDPNVRIITWNYPNDTGEPQIIKKQYLGDVLAPPQTPNRPGWTEYYYKLEDGSKLTDTTEVSDNHTITVIYQSEVTINWDTTKLEYYYQMRPLGGDWEKFTLAPGQYLIDEGTLVNDVKPYLGFFSIRHNVLSDETDIRRINPVRYSTEGLDNPYSPTNKIVSPEMTVYIDVITKVTFKVKVFVDGVFDHDLQTKTIDDITTAIAVENLYYDDVAALKARFRTDGEIRNPENDTVLSGFDYLRDASDATEQTWVINCRYYILS